MKRTNISFTEYYQGNGGFCVNIIRLLCRLYHKGINNTVRRQWHVFCFYALFNVQNN